MTLGSDVERLLRVPSRWNRLLGLWTSSIKLAAIVALRKELTRGRRLLLEEQVCALLAQAADQQFRLEGVKNIVPRIGRSPSRPFRIGRCLPCQRYFITLKRGRSFCSRACMGKSGRCGRPRKLPSGPILLQLYVAEQWSTPEIARCYGVTDPHTVRTALLRFGVTLRRRTNARRCSVRQCHAPVFKIRHAKNGSWYGRRCEQHWRVHRTMLSRLYRRNALWRAA
jgi:hypothetical protein